LLIGLTNQLRLLEGEVSLLTWMVAVVSDYENNCVILRPTCW